MSALDKSSVREETDQLKEQFEQLSAEGKLFSEATLLFTSLLLIVDLILTNPSDGSESGDSRSKYQSCAALKVLQEFTSPFARPILNQRTRCAELPWVKDSGVI